MARFRQAALLVFLLASAARPAWGGDPPPATQPLETRTGSFEVGWPLPPQPQFSKRLDWLMARFGGAMTAQTLQTVRAKATAAPAYRVYVPHDYTPGKPYGLMIWIDPGDGGEPGGDWKKVLDARSIIWVAPRHIPNPELILWRAFMGFQALDNARQVFTIDDQRVYTAGVSGGGRIASDMALVGADTISGGFFFCGVNFYKATKVSDHPGFDWPGFNSQLDPTLLGKARREDRYVLLTGTKDFNLKNTKDAYKGYVADGFKFVTYLEVPGMGHSVSDGEWFDKGIVALDAPVFAAADKAYHDAAIAEKLGRVGEACQKYSLAALHSQGQPWTQDAQDKSATLRARFDQDLAAVHQLIADKQLDKALAAARALQRTWGPLAKDRYPELMRAIGAARSGKGV